MTDRSLPDAGRRHALRTLTWGGLGLGFGGMSMLAACSDGGGSGGASGTATTGLGATSTTVPQTPYDPSRPYWLQGNFAPVLAESTHEELTVRGSIPPELSGLFVRNGSNPPSGESLHWFLGDGMIHGLRIEGGKASWYRNRYISTPIHAAGKDLLDFGGVPGGENSQSNVAMVHHGGRLLATGEVGWPYEISTTDLSTVGAFSYDGGLGDNMTAHPKIDPATGKMHFFGYGFLSPGISYYVAEPDGTLSHSTEIPLDQTVMIHDFAITETDVIFWLGPVLFGTDESAMYPQIPFHWDPAGPSKVGVMPLGGTGDQIRWVDIDPCFVFHGLNAHRDGDDVVAQVHRLATAFGADGDLVDSYLTEWRIGTGGNSLTFSETRISDRVMDLPTHDRRHTGRPTRHGWCATTTPAGSEWGFELAGICHIDTETGDEDLWEPEANIRAGEGCFVPAGDGEGEGYVLTYLWNRGTNLSSFAIFEAQDLAKGPVAEIDLPVRVPFGFHGLWIDEADLA